MSGNGKLVTSKLLIHFPDNDRLGHYDGDTIDGVPSGKATFTAITSYGEKYYYMGEFSEGIYNGLGERRFEDFPDDSEISTFTNGVFTPTPKELFAYLGQREDARYDIRSKSAEFLSNHEYMFTANSQEGLDAFIDTEYRHHSYIKSPDKFGDKLIKIAALNVIQISEFEALNYDAITFILAQDASNNAYFIHYLGSTDIYQGNYITAYVLPLDYFTYDNVNGGQTWAVACAAAYLEK